MTVIYAVPVSASDPDDATARSLIAPNRLERIDRLHGSARDQSFAATLLLEYAVARCYPSVAHPLPISIAEGGKPHLVAHPNIHFSLSHSNDWAVCAVSDLPVGVDIQLCEPGRHNIAARFFHKDEIRYINDLPVYKRDDAFYSMWVLKESFIKATGCGNSLPLRSFCINLQPPSVNCDEISGHFSLSLIPFPADRHYRLGVCVEGRDGRPPVLEIVTQHHTGQRL